MKHLPPGPGRPGLRRPAALLLALAAALALANLSCACTGIYCWDSATITVRRTSGERLLVATSLDLDGTKIDCPAPIVDGSAGFSFQQCHENVQMRSSASSLVIEVKETAPRRIGMVLRDGNTVLAERTFAPRYETRRPNGDFCEPTCRQWQDTWTLP
jgi:hypothetical protein